MIPLGDAGDSRPPTEEALRISDVDKRVRKERRRRLIERLDEKERLLGPQSQGRRGQMNEEELAAEIEKLRTLNAARGGGASL